MMKQSLMDMCVPVEQENKRELVSKFGTKKESSEGGSFLYLNLKGSENEYGKMFQKSSMGEMFYMANNEGRRKRIRFIKL